MKKIITILLIVCMLHTVSFAAPSAENNNEMRTIDISGVSETKSGKVSVTIVKKAEGISPSDLGSSILFYELKTDENGSYSGQFTLPATAQRGAYYSVYVSGDDESGEFYYATDEEISNCILSFQSATEDNIKGLLESFTAPENVLGITLGGEREKYAAWSEKAMAQFLEEEKPESIEDIIDSFDKSNEAAFLMGGDSKEIEKALNENLLQNGVSEDVSFKALCEMFESVRGKVKTEEVENVSEFIADKLREATAIVKINSATKGIMTEILKEYNDVLELDLDKKYEANEIKVNKALTDKNFKTLKEVRKAFENALTEKKTPVSGGGGGSAGGGGVSAGASPVIEFAPTVKEENKEIKNPFSDIEGVAWAKDAILTLSGKGIISGYEDGTFKPQREVTRAEFTKLISSFITGDSTDKSSFKDVKSSDWFAPFIEKAVAAGIVNGYGDVFCPANSITREDACVIIYRILKDKVSFTAENAFSDEAGISDYALDAVKKMAGAGIVNGMGNGTFCPKATLTRAQAAVLINSVVGKLQ